MIKYLRVIEKGMLFEYALLANLEYSQKLGKAVWRMNKNAPKGKTEERFAIMRKESVSEELRIASEGLGSHMTWGWRA